MYPELLSQSIIKPLIDIFDPEKKGAAIEIGVGSDNFYSLEFNKYGLECVAVDPLPHQPFLKIAAEKGIHFEEACIYDKEGEITIFCGDSTDLSSLNKDWWGVNGKNQKQVQAILLTTLLKKYNINKITFMKVDTEGSELEIIKQLVSLDPSQIPGVLEFEYGGGATKQSGQGAWNEQYFNKIIAILKILKELEYKQGLILDSNDGQPAFFDYASLTDLSGLFKPNFEYGNILVFKRPIKNKMEFENILLKTQTDELLKTIEAWKVRYNELNIKFLKAQYRKRLVNKTKTIFNNWKKRP